MRLGQISFVNFVSKIVTSVGGFVATVVITQLLGSGVFGTYALIIAVVIWLKTIAVMGVRSAVIKRASETGETSEYVVAGAGILVAILLFLSAVLVTAQGYVDSYIGTTATYSIIALTWSVSLLSLATGVLHGQHLVHYAALLRPVDIGIRSVVQIAAVVLGFSLGGILFGYGLGAIIAAFIGLVYIVDLTPKRPDREHFDDLFGYAKFAWLGTLSSRTFTSMDTIVLGLFVSVNLIGIYEVSWNLASLLAVFGAVLGQTLFPEFSKLSSAGNAEEVRSLLEKSIAFSGLFLIPGLVGAVIIGDLVLYVYGNEFPRGHYILVLLVLSRLVYNYADQLLTVLNGIDRPDLAFRANAAFVVVNLSLNLVLVYLYGWYGAAVATVVSAVAALVISYRHVRAIIDGVPIPGGELARQAVAAGMMSVVVYIPRQFLPDIFAVGVALTVLGATVYFVSLFGLSSGFRTTVADNLPVL
ncbi:polysaccharide biosynthesis protein [Natronomonas salina]|uniref:oligosaccharide flippase family protein n=1 Tax=Natronomonas salina TaxID=1710540 RepID=UPI0015B613C9|nr:oligosaccharide flippase family protein [Natronomonas salina]QLD90784.1 polysaccharide biosynthesis protein [Natronomonas salina]